jgi:hypothetical protein
MTGKQEIGKAGEQEMKIAKTYARSDFLLSCFPNFLLSSRLPRNARFAPTSNR